MVGEALEKKLYEAASRGDLTTFQQLLQGDPYILDGVSLAGSRNLLHIATMWGQAAIVEEILKIHPQLAQSLDSQKLSPLHIAAAQGHTQIATKLSSVAPEMCWRRDCHGMNPIHIAAMKGHIEILEELIQLDRFPAMEKVDGGQTVLHLCVKHRRFRELVFLVGELGDLLHSKNDDGETILHLAAKYEQLEMIEFLVENTKIDKQSRDTRGRTAFVILEARPGYADSSYLKMLSAGNESLKMEVLQFLDKMSEATMVVAVLIAAMAFQSIVNPPGGVWQEDSPLHKAGQAVMASTHPTVYIRFVCANTLAFVFSFSTIIQLLTRKSLKHPLLIYGVVYSVFSSMACLVMSYVESVTAITPNTVPSLVTGLRIFVIVLMSVSGFQALLLVVIDIQSFMFLEPISYIDLIKQTFNIDLSRIPRDQHATP